MIIVPSHDEPYFRRAVTDQVLEGFTHFRSERMGVFEEESVKRYMEESESLRDLLHLMPITGQGMRMLLACPLAGLAFVKRKLEAMYRMVSDLHYAYELDEFACFLLNEIIEQLQPKRSDARLSLLFPEADREDQNGKLNQEVSDDDAFWHTTSHILAQAVKRDDVEFVHRFVVLGRVSGAYDNPVLGNAMASECLELQELKHRGVKRFGNAVNLVEEQYAATLARSFHIIVNRAYDFAHRVLRCLVAESFKFAVHDTWQAERALTGMMRHRVRYDANFKLLGNLLDDRGFPDSGSADQKHRSLPCGRNYVHSGVIALEICLYRILDVLFRCRDVHT